MLICNIILLKIYNNIIIEGETLFSNYDDHAISKNFHSGPLKNT